MAEARKNGKSGGQKISKISLKVIKMTIGKKLFSWFMVPVILALVLGIITFVNLRTIDNNIKLLINEDWKGADSNMEFGSKHTQKILG